MFRKKGRQSLVYTGSLDRQITLRLKVSGGETNIYGESINDTDEGTTVSAYRVPKDGGEGLEQDRDTSTNQTIFEIRYYPGLNAKYAVLEDVGGVLYRYNILSVIELGRREGMRIICERQS